MIKLARRTLISHSFSLRHVADSPKFGQHVSFEAMKELVYDAKALETIHAFLDKHGASFFSSPLSLSLSLTSFA